MNIKEDTAENLYQEDFYQETYGTIMQKLSNLILNTEFDTYAIELSKDAYNELKEELVIYRRVNSQIDIKFILLILKLCKISEFNKADITITGSINGL